jgi:hypothetical protein
MAKTRRPQATAQIWSQEKNDGLQILARHNKVVPGIFAEIDECLDAAGDEEERENLRALRDYARVKEREPAKTSYEQFSNDTAKGFLIIIAVIVIIVVGIVVYRAMTGEVVCEPHPVSREIECDIQ